MHKRMVEEARKIYEAIFPTDYRTMEADQRLLESGPKFLDTAPSEYCAPSDDCA
jgi:hypothetical protein